MQRTFRSALHLKWPYSLSDALGNVRHVMNGAYGGELECNKKGGKMSPSSVTFKLIVVLWVLGCLFACTSQCEKSQTLAKELLEQLSAPESAELLYMKEVENLALQGTGTGFGIDVLYSSSEEYPDIVSRYQELLTQQGWVNVVLDGYSYYCYPGYRSVKFWMWQYDEDDFADSGAGNVIPTAKTTYPTLYVVEIYQFPFDGDSDCGQ